MSLRTTLLSILTMVVLAFAAGMWFVQQATMLPSFLTLERELAARDLQRIEAAFAAEVQSVDKITRDWAAWDDTYRFVVDGYEEYARENLGKDYVSSGNFHGAWYVRTDGTLTFGVLLDPDHDWEPLTVADLQRPRWPLDHPLLRFEAGVEVRSGLLASEHGPLLVSSRPILTSTRAGPSRGWLVMARRCNEELRSVLAGRTGIEFAIRPWSQPADQADAAAIAALAGGAPAVVDAVDEARLHAWTMLRSLTGEPLLLVTATLPRDVAARGRAAATQVFWACLLAGGTLLAALLWLLQTWVVAPVAALTAHAVRIGKDDALQGRIRSPRRDEIGVLAREFDTMVDRLAESRSRVIELARSGGRAEIAGHVLHNVGNVLNSVNVARDALQQRVTAIDPGTLEQVLGLLRAHQDDLGQFITTDQAGRHLPRFLQVLLQEIVANGQAARSELGQLREGIEHMRALVAAQQEYAGAAGVAEHVPVLGLIGRAERIARAKVGGGVAFAVVDVAPELTVFVEQHRVIEVLGNLMINGAQAVGRTGRADGRVCVRAAVHAGRLRIEVEDNGIGIAPDVLPRLFQQGFTTRPDGRGIGLHSIASAVTALGGQIGVSSDGPGQGACFWFEVPCAPVVDRGGRA